MLRNKDIVQGFRFAMVTIPCVSLYLSFDVDARKLSLYDPGYDTAKFYQMRTTHG